MKPFTLYEVMERLKSVDEISLLEILDISAEEIVDRFEDKIEDLYPMLVQDLQGWGE